MNKLKTDARINAIANAVKACNTVIDIGTDHGKLPAKLLIEGICDKVILVDISKDSLQKAVDLFDEFNLRGKFIVSDGFDNVDEQFDYVVISGMGSDLIADILQRGQNKLNDAKLVLGPNLKEESLREFLNTINYCVQYEQIVKVAKNIYTIIFACKSNEILNRKELFLGKIFNEYNNPEIICEYLFKQKKLLLSELKGKKSAKEKDLDKISQIYTKINCVDEALRRFNKYES